MDVNDLIKALHAVPNPSATSVFLGAADAVVAAGDFTGNGAGEDVFTATAHGFVDDEEVVLLYKAAAGVLTGISAGTHVFIVYIDANTFSISATAAGAAIANTADGDALFAPVLATVSVASATEAGIELADAGHVAIG